MASWSFASCSGGWTAQHLQESRQVRHWYKSNVVFALTRNKVRIPGPPVDLVDERSGVPLLGALENECWGKVGFREETCFPMAGCVGGREPEQFGELFILEK